MQANNTTAQALPAESLNEQEAILRTLLDSVADVLLVHDHRGQFVEVNHTAVAELGYSRAELLGMHINDIELERTLVGAGVPEMHGQPVTAECLHRRKDGTTYPVELRIVLLPFRDRSHFLLLARDMTERHRAEAFRQAVLDHTLKSQENERQRLARELHDGPCQVLTSALMRLDAMSAAVNDNRARACITEVRQLVTDAVTELRSMSHTLRPPMLDELGLVPALARLTEETGKGGLVVSFVAAGLQLESDWPNEVSSAIYRMAQETLQNVVRHAGATSVSVALTTSGRHVRLVIEDDGCGFEIDGTKTPGGLGLRGMRERARQVDGSLVIESELGAGTTVFINVPLPAVRQTGQTAQTAQADPGEGTR